jgi:hypothetical protein
MLRAAGETVHQHTKAKERVAKKKMYLYYQF